MSEDLTPKNQNEESASGSDEDVERREAPAPSENLLPGPKPRLRPMTRQQIAANRRNASKSTGPRTLPGKARAAQNRRTHGHYSGQNGGDYGQLIVATMQDLGEDPEKFSRLRQSLMGDLQPRGAAQTLLVEDLAYLRWERQRLERARTALVARRVQQLELQRQRYSLQVNQKTIAEIPVSALKMGLVWMDESATCFQKMLEWLEGLKGRLDVGEFSDASLLIGWLYGSNPTTQGAMIRALFQALSEAQDQAEENHEPAPKFVPDPVTASALGRELLAEICNVTQQSKGSGSRSGAGRGKGGKA